MCPSDNEDEEDLKNKESHIGHKNRGRNFETIEEFESPASFPCTPFSRAQVMNKNAERVISTILVHEMFCAWNYWPHLLTKYSRRLAVEARSAKKMAVYDATQTSHGLTLTCGNHCLMKIGKGLCICSCLCSLFGKIYTPTLSFLSRHQINKILSWPSGSVHPTPLLAP